MDKLFVSLVVVAFFEKALLMLAPETIFLLPNYLRNAGVTFGTNQAISFFGGMHAFGGNRSVSGVLFLVIGIYFTITKSADRRYAICAFAASLMCASGTALLLTAVIFLLTLMRRVGSGTSINKLLALIIFMLCIYILSIIFFQLSEQFTIVEQGNKQNRFSFVYLEFIWKYKAKQIEMYWSDLNQISWLIGGTSPPSNSSFTQPGAFFGDFILLDLFARHGVLGSILLILLFSYMFKSRYLFPVGVMLIGSIHYHVLFSLPGQILFAYFFCKSQKERQRT